MGGRQAVRGEEEKGGSGMGEKRERTCRARIKKGREKKGGSRGSQFSSANQRVNQSVQSSLLFLFEFLIPH